MKYTYSDWNHKHGTIPVNWNNKDYEELPWYENPDKRQGFTTPEENYNIYKERVGCLIPKFEEVGKGVFVPDEVDAIFGYVLEQFNLNDCLKIREIAQFTRATPGRSFIDSLIFYRKAHYIYGPFA